LPPGPIANPGLASLKATLFPAPVDYLYFVSQNDGTHFFSSSLAEHNQAVSRYVYLKNQQNKILKKNLWMTIIKINIPIFYVKIPS